MPRGDALRPPSCTITLRHLLACSAHRPGRGDGARKACCWASVEKKGFRTEIDDGAAVAGKRLGNDSKQRARQRPICQSKHAHSHTGPKPARQLGARYVSPTTRGTSDGQGMSHSWSTHLAAVGRSQEVASRASAWTPGEAARLMLWDDRSKGKSPAAQSAGGDRRGGSRIQSSWSCWPKTSELSRASSRRRA